MNTADVKNYDVLKQVPVDYYARGVETNLLQKFWHKKKWGILKELLKEGSGKLLDVGCCDGTTTYHISLVSGKLKITGVDLYRGTIDYAKSQYKNIDFVFADAHKLPFKSGTFDYVTAIETLEHLESPGLALKEIKRVLKTGGILIIGQDTNSLLFRIIWWLWSRSKGSVWKNSHVSCVAPEKLIKKIIKAGFKIESVKYINLGMEVFVKAKKA